MKEKNALLHDDLGVILSKPDVIEQWMNDIDIMYSVCSTKSDVLCILLVDTDKCNFAEYEKTRFIYHWVPIVHKTLYSLNAICKIYCICFKDDEESYVKKNDIIYLVSIINKKNLNVVV